MGKGMERERKVNPACVNASNPFHQCTDYCAQRSNNPKLRIDAAKRPVPNGEGIGVEGRNVDPYCVNAANPFHQCSENCAKKMAEAKKQTEGRFAFPVSLNLYPRSSSQGSDGSKSALNRERVRVAGQNVDTNCVNASNPFHKCGDYCAKKTTGAKKQINISKTVQNGESSKERKIEEGRKVDPTCVNASNPFHQCTERCSQRTPHAKRQTNGHILEITSEPPQVVRQEC